MRPLKGITY